MSTTPDFTTPEGAKQFLKEIQRRVVELETSENDLEHFARKEDLQKSITDALQLATESRDAAIAQERLDRRFNDNEYGLRDFVRSPRDGNAKATVRMSGGMNRDNEYEEGLLDSSEVHGEWHKDFRDAVSDLNFVRIFKSNPAQGLAAKDVKCGVSLRRVQRLMQSAPDDLRRIFADSANIGAEWIPTITLPRFERDLELARRVEAAFQTFPMASKTVELPYMSRGAQPFLKGAVSSDNPPAYTPSTPATDSRAFVAVGFATLIQVDEDASEDSILAAESIMRQEAVRASNDGTEDAIINADLATHQDTGLANWDGEGRWGVLGSAADHRNAWLGLRARAADISNTTDQAAAQTAAGALVGRGKLDAGYAASSDLLWMPSPFYYVKKMLAFTEVETLDQYGPGATILTGEVARLYGSPVLVSQFVGNQYNAVGVYDNSTKTKGLLICVNRTRFAMGVRRQGAIEAWKDIRNGVTHIAFTTRKHFRTIDDTATKNVHVGYNLTATA